MGFVLKTSLVFNEFLRILMLALRLLNYFGEGYECIRIDLIPVLILALIAGAGTFTSIDVYK